MEAPGLDVAVVGGGPAGCAAAVVLAQAGARVVVFEGTAYDGARVGETLPPEVRLRLQRLCAWDAFVADGHAPSPGILAAWGHDEPHANDFILNPYGCGWRVDRNHFDASLAAVARSAGAVVRAATRVNGVTRERDGGWRLTVSPGDEPVRTGFLVDATGRSSPLRRDLGARRIVHDHMVSLVGVAPAASGAAGSALDRRALIEATEQGWWYSAWLPDNRLVLTFQTEPADGHRVRWAEFLLAAPLTAARAAEAGGEPVVRVVAAHSQRADPLAGEGWLAVGDAAAAHDPVAGLGIMWALESGIAGAEALLAGTTGDYADDMRRHFDQYLATRSDYYRAEGRWPQSLFWSRRAALTTASGEQG